MSSRYGVLESVADMFVPVHRDGHKLLGIGLALTVIFFFIWSPLGWLCAIGTSCLAYFFRDPDRVIPLRDGLVIASADGKIASIEKVAPPVELALSGGDRVRISTVLSLCDMQVSRVPVAGRITRSVYVPGAFFAASNEKASEDNERRALVIETPSGAEIAVLQIAGILSRRIVTFVAEGDSVGVGQRFGLIRFSSRVDIYLPVGAHALVSVGQRMIAGETVVADLKSDEPEREARRG